MMCSCYRVEYVIQRHADVKRNCSNVSAGRNRVAIVLRHDRSLDPVFVRVSVAMMAVTIFRPHSQLTAFSVAHCASFPPRFSREVDAKRREAGVIDDVIRRDVRVSATVVRRTSACQRSWKLDFDVRCRQST